MTTKTKNSNHDCPLLKGMDDKQMKDFGDGLLRTEAQQVCLNCPLERCFYDNHNRKLTRAERGRLGGLVTATRYAHDTLKEWGRLGGLVTAARYEHSILSEWGRKGGRKGGRPRKLKEVLSIPGEVELVT